MNDTYFHGTDIAIEVYAVMSCNRMVYALKVWSIPSQKCDIIIAFCW